MSPLANCLFLDIQTAGRRMPAGRERAGSRSGCLCLPLFLYQEALRLYYALHATQGKEFE